MLDEDEHLQDNEESSSKPQDSEESSSKPQDSEESSSKPQKKRHRKLVRNKVVTQF